DDQISFRMRVTASDSQGNFGSVGIIGVDVNQDGKLDLFIGIDDRQGTPTVTLFDPGTGANNSPSTTSITPARTFTGTALSYQFVAVSATSDSEFDGNTDVDGGGKTDYFVSFKTSFDQ